MLATLESKIVAAFAFIGLLAIVFGAGYIYRGKIDSAKYDLKTAQEHLAIAKVIQTATDENEAMKTQLEVQHEQANAALNVLLSAPAPIVRVPTCRSSSQANSPAGSIQTEQANGVLPTEAERILGADRQRTWSNIGEAEQELNDCRVAKNWAAAQASSVK